MKLLYPTCGKIKILVSDSEIKEYFGGYGNISENNAKTIESINRVLKKAVPERFLKKLGNKILFEMSKTDSGCIISLSSSVIRKENELLLIFKSFENLIFFCSCLKTELKQSELYKFKNDYILFLPSKLSKNIVTFSKEFCKAVIKDKKISAAVKEYGTLICKNNAIEKIKKSFKGI